MVRTRFAPSPTGYLHIGGARTALFSWAYARRYGGKFILRIEDTDRERSTEAATQAILDAMEWLNLDYDEGPFYQMQRLARYQEVAQYLIREGKAYYCYASREELDAMREAQRARGEKPRYDGRWRPENARGKTPPAGVEPVVRFRNPDDGEVVWTTWSRARSSSHNSELDDLVILRADGVPTYNFGVVVDDLDMSITHVIRGDDHVNNTPRQINIFRALGAALPKFAHVPMILGPDGERLSKRHGAVSVMQYVDDGYLPEALVNYLARLGWSHGDEEVFSREQLVEWFDLEHISKSAARFDPQKLQWLNAHYIKQADDRSAGCAGAAIPAEGRRRIRIAGRRWRKWWRCSRSGSAPSKSWPTRRSTSTAPWSRRAELRTQHYIRGGHRRAVSARNPAWRPSSGRARAIGAAVKADRRRAQAQDAQDRHAAASDGDRRDPDAVHRCHPGADRPGREPRADAAGAGAGGTE